MVQGLAKDPGQLSRMVLLVQSRQGYLNLCELLARAGRRTWSRPRRSASWAWLHELARA
jgi:DNA polymerase-3 subunit alpha